MKDQKSHWNYRICSYTHERDNQRYLAIREIHYKDDIPVAVSTAELDNVNEFESLDDITWTIDAMKSAMNKPILDLDNFPEELKN